MRLVDIFFKNIHGQASDIKGNLNTVGHLMFLAADPIDVPEVSGYFELDGSTVLNAKTNYPELFALAGSWGEAAVVTSYLPMYYRRTGINIDPNGIGSHLHLGRKSAPVFSKGDLATEEGGVYYFEKTRNIKYAVGSSSAKELIMHDHYTARLFVYHGVHV